MLKLVASDFQLDAAAPDTLGRTISGVAVPYNRDATVMSGEKVRFIQGSLPTDGASPKLFLFHQSDKPVGLVTERVDTPEGMLFTARISASSMGTDAATLVAEKVIDQVSIGVNPIKWKFDGDTMVVTKAEWYELSLVSHGAFGDGAVITDIAASIHQNEEPIDKNENEVQEQEPEMSESVEAPAVIEPATIATFAQPRRAFKLPSAAEYLAAFSRNDDTLKNIHAAIAEQRRYEFAAPAAPSIDTESTPGIVPNEILAPVYDGLNAIRPLVTAIGTRAMPTYGATFRRPKITVRPDVTQQPTGQLNTLDPSTVQVSNSDVAKKTFGTYVVMSEQDMDWTDPAAMNIVLNQLAIAYGQATDAYACAELEDKTTQTESVTQSPQAFIAGIYNAAATISSNSNYLPTHLFVAPDRWSWIAQICDDAGRPVFPFIGAPGLAGQNAMGNSAASSWNGNPLGLTLVVDKNLSEGTMIVGHAAGAAAGFEFYEQMNGAISIAQPAVLGRQIAFRGYAATWMADATKFVALV
jgi:HK97 family phage prohead protease